MDDEMVRDCALAESGLLVRKLGGLGYWRLHGKGWRAWVFGGSQ